MPVAAQDGKTMKQPLLLACLLGLSPLAQANGAQPLGCLIDAAETAELGSPVTGVLASVAVERGDRVHAGQVLATLRDAVERAQIDVARSRADTAAEIRAARANLALADERLKRSRDLQARNFISAQALDQAVAERQVAVERLAQARDLQAVSQRELELARARLGERTLQSPFDGIVTDRYLTVGERVEDKPVLRLARLHPLRVEVVLPNTLYGKVTPGMLMDVRPDLPTLGVFSAEVSRVDKVLDAASNTFRAQLTLANADHAIPAGVRCAALIVDRVETGAQAKPASLPAPAAAEAPALRLDTRLPDFGRGTATPRTRM